jgi:hypothetical protein
MVSPAQWAYAFALAGLFWLKGPTMPAFTLLGAFLALLAIAGAMDFQIIGQSDARLFMLIVWVCVAAALAMQPGSARVMAAVAAIVIAGFTIGMLLHFPFSTTSAIVNAGAFIMLAVYGVGLGSGGDTRRGHADMPLSVGISARDIDMGERGVAQSAGLLSQDRRGQ